MTIQDEFSSFSQYFQTTTPVVKEKKPKQKKLVQQTFDQFLQKLDDGSQPERYFQRDAGYLSDDDTDGSLDGFIVPDDYLTEEDYDSSSEPPAEFTDEESEAMDEEEMPPPRSSLPRAAKTHRKRAREADITTPPPLKKRKARRSASPIGIRFRSSEEYSNLTALYERKGSYKIVGRDEVVQRIKRLVTQEDGGMRPLLIGPPNIGKCGIVRHLAENLAMQKEKDPLCRRSVVMLDCQAVVSNWIAAEDNLQIAMIVRKKVAKLLKSHANPIVYFRNIDAFLKYDESTDFLRSFFGQPINMIASISADEKSEIVGKCQKILAPYNFKTLKVNECGMEHLPTIISQNLEAKPFPYKNVKLSKKALSTAIRLADKHIKDRPFPAKAINLIREAASFVYQRSDSADMKQVIQPEDIAEIVYQDTGITVKELMSNSLGHLIQLEKELNERIVAQPNAIRTVCAHVKRSRIGLGRVDKPAGVFLFVGPSGVGKTLLGIKLAEGLYHDKDGFERINMEGYSEPTSLSKLIGTAPGYVGFELPGSLDRKISRKSHMVIIFDEIEKAHPEVVNFLLGLFDTGFFENGKGEKIDCRNAIFIMTSNVGAEELMEASKEKDLDEKAVMECVDTPLKESFSPEFLNRMDEVVPFRALKEEDCPAVGAVHLEDIKDRYYQSNRIVLSWDESVIDHFSENAYRPEYGMRNLGRMIDQMVGKAVTDLIEREEIIVSGKVHISIDDDALVAEKLED